MTLRADQIIRRLVSACYSSVVLERFGFTDCGYELDTPAETIINTGDVVLRVISVNLINFGGAIVSASLNSRPYVAVIGENAGAILKMGVVLDGSKSVGRIVDEIHRIIEGE